jgi:RHS repeat-associated protein
VHFAGFDADPYLTTERRPNGDPNWFGSLATEQTDASGFQYKRNRYYDPSSGRFTQEDPIGLAGGLNVYGYGSGDPVNYSDPFGLCPQWLDGTPCTLQDVANYAAGVGDALSFGITSLVRQATPGGDGVNYGSGQYTAGIVTGALVDLVGGAVASGRVAPEGPQVKTEVVERAAPGRDGGKSTHVLEKVGGKTNSVTHRVEVNGKLVHQHQTHVGKYGAERRFPDEWTGTKTIDKP